ncbi:unnamed protein product [Penicillium pancosmium]
MATQNKTPTACATCRSKKVKCSGTIPCDYCEDRRLECRPASKTQRRFYSVEYVEELERRLETCENARQLPASIRPGNAVQNFVYRTGSTDTD